MSLTTSHVRRIEKFSNTAGEVPTIPSSIDHTDGTWISTDIYIGEIFINIPDGKAYTRNDEGIVQLFDNNRVISGCAITNGSDAKTYHVASGIILLNGVLVTFAGGNIVLLNDGDPSAFRVDAIVMDSTGALNIQQGSTNILHIPDIASNLALIGSVFVPQDYVAASNPKSIPIQNGIDIRLFSKTISTWQAGMVFPTGCFCSENNIFYKCLATHLSSNSFDDDFDDGDWEVLYGSLEQTVKVTVSSLDFKPNATNTGTIDILTLPAGAVVTIVKVKHNGQFKDVGSSISSASLNVVDSTGINYISALDIFQAPSATKGAVFNESTTSIPNQGADTFVRAVLTLNGGAAIDDLQTASFDIWIKFTILI